MPNDNVTALVSEESGTTSGLTTASEHLQTADTTISLCEATEIPREGISHGCAVMRDELYSPTTSTLSSTYLTTEVAPLRWFGLLADDADNIFDASIFDAPSFRDMFQGGEHDHYAFTPLGNDHSDRSCVSNPGQSLPPPHNAGPGAFEASHSGASKEPWQVSSILEDHEVPIFRRFVTHLSLWLDLFDPLKHFSTLVSQMAMENAGLMKAILALSARHMSIKLIGTDFHLLDRTVAIRYYYETLQYLQGAMKHESYTQSLELIATAVIVSMYEMIDGAGNGWERHLKGVFWILRQQDVNGESGGLKQAGWWAWLRQDIWAAFRERRRCLSIYKPTRAYAQMDQYDVASRIVYLLSQSVNYSCEDDIKLGERDLQLRIKRGKKLLSMLDEWSGKLPVHFRELPLGQTAFPERVFKPIWIEPSVFAVALQMHSFARILVLANQPATAGYRDLLAREGIMLQSIDTICGIAMTLEDEPASVMSTQCVFAAGLYAREDSKRQEIKKLLTLHQSRTGWPPSSLAEELEAEWRSLPQ